jgi:hypothetical protein
MCADTDPDQVVDLLINGTTASALRRAAIKHEKS